MTCGASPTLPPMDPEAILALLGPWEAAKLDQLAKKVVHQLSHRPAMGIFAEYRHSSLWGEYSHHVQMGYFEGVSDHLDDMAADVCETVAETVPCHEMQLFDRLAEACGEEDGMSGIIYLIEGLKDEVSSRAASRNLDRYADDYRWFENL